MHTPRRGVQAVRLDPRRGWDSVALFRLLDLRQPTGKVSLDACFDTREQGEFFANHGIQVGGALKQRKKLAGLAQSVERLIGTGTRRRGEEMRLLKLA
jgi:hypothetical protein